MNRERFLNVEIQGRHGVLDVDTLSFAPAPANSIFSAVDLALSLERGEIRMDVAAWLEVTCPRLAPGLVPA